MRNWSVLGAGLLLFTALTPALAQENGPSLTSPMDASIGREYGFLANGRKLTDTILVVRTPQFSYINRSPRTDSSARYQPELELFDNNRSLNSLNHTGTASWSYKVSERWSLNATDDALVTRDPSRSIAGSLILLPRRGFKQNMAHAAANYEVTRRNTVSLSFDNVAASAPLNSVAFPAKGHLRSSGTVSFARTFERKQILTGTYSLLTARAQYFGVSYEGALARDLVIHLSTGLLKDAGENYLFSGQVDKRVGRLWMNASYHRFLSIFGTSTPGGIPIGNDLLLPASVSRRNVYQVYSTGLSGQLNKRAGVEVRAAVTRNNSGTADRDINNASGRLKFDYRLADRLGIFTDLQFYSQSFNVFIGTAIDRRRYVAGVRIDVSPRSNRVSDTPELTKPTQR